MKKIIKTSSGIYISKQDYSKNLVAKWVFDDTYSENGIKAVNGNKINDLSGNKNALISHNLEFKNDKDLDRCAYFNGDNAYCEVIKRGCMPLDKFSINMSIKLDQAKQNGFILMDSDNANEAGIEMAVWDKDESISFSIRNSLGQYNENTVLSKMPIMKDVQTNCLILYDKNNNLSCCINDYTKIIEKAPVVKPLRSHSYNLYIGKPATFNDYFFRGFIKSIEVYDACIEFEKHKKFLLEQNSQLYTIKSDFYDLSKSQYKPLTDVDINNITDEDLRKYGFDNIEDILTETTAGDEKFKPIEKLKSINDGKFNIITKELED